MKKLRMVPNSGFLFAKPLRGALVLLLSSALSFALWTTAAAVGREPAPAQNIQSTSLQTQSDKEKDTDKSKEGSKEGDKKGDSEDENNENCIVCSKGKDKAIECDEVREWLNKHPGDTRGRCQATPVTNR
ncbi:MAG TPA: hypothetical protein VN904_02130 [Chthoniobacterales bacterium]|nr:hypothetical protein [Chthoniobacterales bacterium]